MSNWLAQLSRPAGVNEVDPYDITEVSGGSALVVTVSSTSVRLVKLSNAGAVVWSTIWDWSGNPFKIGAVAGDSSSDLFVLAATSTGTNHLAISRVSATTGAEVWRREGFISSQIYTAWAKLIGSTLYTARIDGSNTLAVSMLSATDGTVTGGFRYNYAGGTSDTTNRCVIWDASGNTYVIRNQASAAELPDSILTKISPAGSIIYQVKIDVPAGVGSAPRATITLSQDESELCYSCESALVRITASSGAIVSSVQNDGAFMAVAYSAAGALIASGNDSSWLGLLSKITSGNAIGSEVVLDSSVPGATGDGGYITKLVPHSDGSYLATLGIWWTESAVNYEDVYVVKFVAADLIPVGAHGTANAAIPGAPTTLTGITVTSATDTTYSDPVSADDPWSESTVSHSDAGLTSTVYAFAGAVDVVSQAAGSLATRHGTAQAVYDQSGVATGTLETKHGISTSLVRMPSGTTICAALGTKAAMHGQATSVSSFTSAASGQLATKHGTAQFKMSYAAAGALSIAHGTATFATLFHAAGTRVTRHGTATTLLSRAATGHLAIHHGTATATARAEGQATGHLAIHHGDASFKCSFRAMPSFKTRHGTPKAIRSITC